MNALNVPTSSVTRLGKQNNEPKPKKLLYESTESKDSWLNTDLTDYQRGFLSAMKKERDQRNSLLGVKTVFVKCIHGSPTLAEKKKKQTN